MINASKLKEAVDAYDAGKKYTLAEVEALLETVMPAARLALAAQAAPGEEQAATDAYLASQLERDGPRNGFGKMHSVIFEDMEAALLAASLHRHRPVEARVTEAECAQPDGEHDWFIPERIGYECCRKCGIVRRADGKNKPCKGHVRVGPRDSSLPSPQVTRMVMLDEIRDAIRHGKHWCASNAEIVDRVRALFDGRAKR